MNSRGATTGRGDCQSCCCCCCSREFTSAYQKFTAGVCTLSLVGYHERRETCRRVVLRSHCAVSKSDASGRRCRVHTPRYMVLTDVNTYACLGVPLRMRVFQTPRFTFWIEARLRNKEKKTEQTERTVLRLLNAGYQLTAGMSS
jgi:hypothetical protein